MLESMTGYGRGEHVSRNMRAFAEIRSVNYRYCEVSLKIPTQLQHFEQLLKDKVQKKVNRGKVTLTVLLEHHATNDEPVHIQEAVLKKHLKTLEKVREIAGITEPVRLDHLLAFEQLFEPAENNPEILQNQYDVVEKAAMAAVNELVKMRRKEGRHLQKDLEQRMKLLEEHCSSVEMNEKERIIHARIKLTERLNQLLEETRMDEDRIEQEIAILAERLDISEELVRMGSHISFFTECLKNETTQGKKLNFILQEMHREVNTIGSKANSSTISRAVGEMKEIIENIREQIQNIA